MNKNYLLIALVAGIAIPAQALASGTGCNETREPLEYPKCNEHTDPKCMKCKGEIENQSNKMHETYDDNTKKCRVRAAACSQAINSGIGSLKPEQLDQIGGAKDKASAMNYCKNEQVKEDAMSAKVAKECKDKLKTACAGTPGANEYKKCAAAENEAKRNHASNSEKAAAAGADAAKGAENGMNLGDLAKLAAAAAPLLAQMAQKKDDSGTSASSYQPTNYPDNTNSGISDTGETEKKETEVASLNDGKAETGGNGVNGVSFGNPNASTVSVASKEGMRTGFNPSQSSDGRKIASAGNGSSPFGAAVANGGVGSSGGGSGAGGSGSSGNSTGASKMGDGHSTKSESEKAFEMSMTGGAKLLGLKSGKEDLDELTSAGSGSTGGDAKLDDISAKAGASHVAAADAAMGDESIFLRVRKKLSSIKMSGRL